MAEYGQAVANWLTATRTRPVLLAGHSSGTQVAAEPEASYPSPPAPRWPPPATRWWPV
jgi:hypothetical protein